MYAEGVRVNGKKYAIIRYDRNARLVNAAQTGIGGVVLQATKRGIHLQYITVLYRRIQIKEIPCEDNTLLWISKLRWCIPHMII